LVFLLPGLRALESAFHHGEQRYKAWYEPCLFLTQNRGGKVSLWAQAPISC